MNYRKFTMIEKECPLASFFNKTMRKLLFIRTFAAPSYLDAQISDEQIRIFYDFCLYETWMHAVVNRLFEWKDLIHTYFSEYDGRWEYFSASMRTLNKDDEAPLEDYSIVHYFLDEGARDIVVESLPHHINTLCGYLISFSRMDILQGLKKHFKDIVSYRQSDDGTFQEMTREDYELFMVSNQVDADDDCKRLKAIAAGIKGIVEIIHFCKHDDDNTAILQMVNDAVSSLLSTDFASLNKVIDDFLAKYENR